MFPWLTRATMRFKDDEVLGRVRSLTLRELGDRGEERIEMEKKKEVVRVLGEIQRLFPCIMPSIRQGHTVDDLTGLWLGEAASAT